MRTKVEAKQGAKLVQGPTEARPAAQRGGWRRFLPFGRRQPSAQEKLRRAVAAGQRAVVAERPRVTRWRLMALGVLAFVVLVWAETPGRRSPMRTKVRAKQGAKPVQGPTEARPAAQRGGWRRFLPFGRQQPSGPSAQEELRQAVAAEQRAVVAERPRGWRRFLPRPRLTRGRLIVLGVLAFVVLVWALVAVRSTSMYEASVLITGQTGIGLPPPTEELDFGDVSAGLNMSRELTLTNDGQFDSFVVIVAVGGIRDFMHISDAFFVLDRGEEKTVRFQIIVPDGAELKQYSGKVLVFRMPWGVPFASAGLLPW